MKLVIEIQENRSCNKDRPKKAFVQSSFVSNDYNLCNNKSGRIAEALWDKSFIQALEVARLTELSQNIEELVKEYYDSEANKFSVCKSQ